MNFERGKDVKDALSIGGYSFDTLRPGAVLKVLRWFALSKAEGKIRGYHSGSIQLKKNYYILITRIEPAYSGEAKRKNIHFILHPTIERIEEDREILLKKQAYPGWRKTAHFGNISKRIFEYRLEIIKPGF